MDNKPPSLTRFAKDKEICAKIYMVYIELEKATDLKKEEKDKFVECLISVMRKLECVKYHKDNAFNLIDKEIKALKKDIPKDGTGVAKFDLTTGLESEVEGFLMQGKSCLDVLVKCLKPILNRDFHTYGDSGEDVISILENNVPKNLKPKSKKLVDLIKIDKSWIKRWFKDERDTVTHYRSIESSGIYHFDKKNERTIWEPKHEEGISYRELLSNLYYNLISFCEEFLAIAMAIRFRPMFELCVIDESETDKNNSTKFRPCMLKQQQAT